MTEGKLQVRRGVCLTERPCRLESAKGATAALTGAVGRVSERAAPSLHPLGNPQSEAGMATTSKKKQAPEIGTGEVDLVPWSRPPRGPERRYPWIPSSSGAALADLQELPGEQFGELVRTLVPFLTLARDRRTPLPHRLMLIARDAGRAARELERVQGQGGLPSEPVVDGRPLVDGQPDVSELVAQAREGLRASSAALVVASTTSRDQILRGELFQPDAHPRWEDIGDLLRDHLASVVASLKWVTGTDLAYVAIWLGVDEPLPRGTVDAMPLEEPRQRWDARLRRARKLRDAR